MPKLFIRLIAAFALCGNAAFANDSVATLGAGGLVLVNSVFVEMAKEELYISPERVTVDYVFRNPSGKDVIHLVAFPMPLIDPSYLNSDLPITSRDDDNFLNFKLWINDQPLTPKIELRAFAGPIDITDQIVSAGLPLNPMSDATIKAFMALPLDRQVSIARNGGALDQGGDQLIPAWSFKVTYYWEQVFPAKSEVKVRHEYVPGTGAFFFYPDLLKDKAMMAKYCVDEGTRKSISTLKSDVGPIGLVSEVNYILTTGANWAGEIGDFRLVVDKLKPDSIVSFCGEGVRKISPTQFEMKKQQFYPQADLSIMVLSRPQE